MFHLIGFVSLKKNTLFYEYRIVIRFDCLNYGQNIFKWNLYIARLPHT